MSISLGAVAGFVAHLGVRPVITTVSAPQVGVPVASRSVAEKRPTRQLTAEENRILEQMTKELSGNIFSADYNKGARILFGGDYAKMREATKLAGREEHFRDLESAETNLRYRFSKEETFEGKIQLYRESQLARARNLELIRVIYERGDELRKFRAEDKAGFKNEGAASAADQKPPAPAKLFQ